MKKLFYVVACALALTGFGACGDDGTEPVVSKESGINSKDFDANIVVSDEGEVKNLTFDVKGDWSIVAAKTWCKFEPSKGPAGKNSVTLTAEPNSSNENRTAKITITVQGHEAEVLCVIEQKGEVEPPTLNSWIHETMKESYLWNEEYRQLDMEPYMGTLGFSAFLQKGIEGVDAMDHINIEDGGWVYEDGKQVREYFSNIKQVGGGALGAPSKMPQTRTEASGLGFVRLLPTYFNEDGVKRVGIGVLAVYPNSPAAKAGVQRGTYFNRVNGTTITNLNYETLVKQFSITSGTLKLGTAICSVENGELVIDENGPTIELTAGTYDESVIYNASVVTLADGKDTKVGYLTYGQFDYAYDLAVIDIFKQFKEQNVSELILDLRYNGGGHVMSSTMLATLIAGNKYKDQIYARMEYNKERTEAGVEGAYLIGNSLIPDGQGVYSLISDALQYSLELDHVYVIGSFDTASASEMVINGLRGLGIDVRLVGQQTHGKNVGMEVWQRTAGTITVQFSPITFRVYNAKNECDYADGFIPDLITPKETEAAVWGFGSPYETVGGWALLWIANGEKPKPNASSMVMQAPGTGLRLRCGDPIDLSKKPAMNGAYVFAAENE